MPEYIGCFVVELFHCFTEHIYPAFYICACRPVYKWVTPVEYQVAHMYNVLFFKMNDAVAISMAGTIVIQRIFNIRLIGVPYASESLIRVELFVFGFLS